MHHDQRQRISRLHQKRLQFHLPQRFLLESLYFVHLQKHGPFSHRNLQMFSRSRQLQMRKKLAERMKSFYSSEKKMDRFFSPVKYIFSCHPCLRLFICMKTLTLIYVDRIFSPVKYIFSRHPYLHFLICMNVNLYLPNFHLIDGTDARCKKYFL